MRSIILYPRVNNLVIFADYSYLCLIYSAYLVCTGRELGLATVPLFKHRPHWSALVDVSLRNSDRLTLGLTWDITWTFLKVSTKTLDNPGYQVINNWTLLFEWGRISEHLMVIENA